MFNEMADSYIWFYNEVLNIRGAGARHPLRLQISQAVHHPSFLRSGPVFTNPGINSGPSYLF
jgi:hypothetical protein